MLLTQSRVPRQVPETNERADGGLLREHTAHRVTYDGLSWLDLATHPNRYHRIRRKHITSRRAALPAWYASPVRTTPTTTSSSNAPVGRGGRGGGAIEAAHRATVRRLGDTLEVDSRREDNGTSSQGGRTSPRRGTRGTIGARSTRSDKHRHPSTAVRGRALGGSPPPPGSLAGPGSIASYEDEDDDDSVGLGVSSGSDDMAALLGSDDSTTSSTSSDSSGVSDDGQHPGLSQNSGSILPASPRRQLRLADFRVRDRHPHHSTRRTVSDNTASLFPTDGHGRGRGRRSSKRRCDTPPHVSKGVGDVSDGEEGATTGQNCDTRSGRTRGSASVRDKRNKHPSLQRRGTVIGSFAAHDRTHDVISAAASSSALPPPGPDGHGVTSSSSAVSGAVSGVVAPLDSTRLVQMACAFVQQPPTLTGVPGPRRRFAHASDHAPRDPMIIGDHAMGGLAQDVAEAYVLERVHLLADLERAIQSRRLVPLASLLQVPEQGRVTVRHVLGQCVAFCQQFFPCVVVSVCALGYR